MAAYVKLFRSIWQDDDFKALAAGEITLFKFLIIVPFCTLLFRHC